MESRKRVDPPHCINGCEFNKSVKNCKLCSKCEKLESSSSTSPPPHFSSSANNNSTIFGCNSVFGASTKTFSFSRDYNNNNNSTSGLIFKFTTLLPETALPLRNFTFGTSTVTKKRCNSCKKRIGMTGFACKCGLFFCGKHRYPEEHNCCFDYKTFGREVLSKENPGLIAEKLHTRI